MRAEHVYVQQRRLWVSLREKGGKAHAMPCRHTLEVYLPGAPGRHRRRPCDPKGPLSRTIASGTGQLSTTPVPSGERLRDGTPAPARGQHRHDDR